MPRLYTTTSCFTKLQAIKLKRKEEGSKICLCRPGRSSRSLLRSCLGGGIDKKDHHKRSNTHKLSYVYIHLNSLHDSVPYFGSSNKFIKKLVILVFLNPWKKHSAFLLGNWMWLRLLFSKLIKKLLFSLILTQTGWVTIVSAARVALGPVSPELWFSDGAGAIWSKLWCKECFEALDTQVTYIDTQQQHARKHGNSWSQQTEQSRKW